MNYPDEEERIALRSADSVSSHDSAETHEREGSKVSVRFRSSDTAPKEKHPMWTEDEESRNYVFKLYTAFYALFIVIFGIVIELSNLITHGHSNVANIKDLVLASYLFGGSIIFIFYCSMIVLKQHRQLLQKRKSMMVLNLRLKPPEMLTNSSTGSLYLRIGAIVFGIIGVVYYGIKTLVCSLGWEGAEKECNVYSMVCSTLAALFIFVQMWFVFCNGKITFIGTPNIARFGLMHLVTTNLWMWLRYILYEEAETLHEIEKAEFPITTTESTFRVTAHGSHAIAHLIHDCKGAHCVFGEYSEFMYTCVVEYSLICAGVAFVFWTSIESAKKEEIDGEIFYVQKKLKKRNIITMDCSRTSEGLFGGFFFVIISIISISLFNAYASRKELSQWIFLGTSGFFFSAAILICGIAFHRMKVLRFNNDKEEEEESAELLDQILLVVGLIGELVYCIGGILAFVNNQNRENLSILLCFVHVLRLIQVSMQSGLLMISSRLILRSEDPEILRYKPGKQTITLMLMVNCALFLMNIFEAQKAGVTEEIVALYGNRSWALLVRGCSPLTIFFRFHSSACFAEVWKKTFKIKRHRSGTTESEAAL